MALEDDNPQLKMRNIVGRDASSVLVPLDEPSYQHLHNIASDPDAPIKLQEIDPAVKSTKGVLMGFSLSLPLSIVLRHPQVEEASRCVSPRDQTETRQVLITYRGNYRRLWNSATGARTTFGLTPQNPFAATGASASGTASRHAADQSPVPYARNITRQPFA